MSVHFSKDSDEWATPPYIWQFLQHEVGRFDLDAAATKENAICKRFYSKDVDALSIPWVGKTVWMNPPYSRVSDFMAKALTESLKGKTVVCLVPARTDTAWLHDYAVRGQIRFLRGRVKFGESKNSAPFPSAIIIYNGKSS